MTFRRITALIVSAFFAAAANGVTASDVAKEKVDALFAAWDKPDSPGCAVAVIKDGVLVHARGYGMANLEHGIAITPTTVFDIASCSKQFTAFSILLLVQEGKLSLDDDIRKLLPEIPDYGRAISIRHLIHHTSGLRDYNALLELDGKRVEDVTTESDALRILTRQRSVNFAAGERHLYSNTGYFLMAVIVKRVSGESVREFARKRIFEPLGMTNTHFHDDHTEIVKSRATAYSGKSDGKFGISMSNWEQLGDGALMTTIEDLAKWDANFYDARVGGRGVLDAMVTPGKLNDGTKLNYAYGLIVGEQGGGPMIHHGGAWAGYRAEMVRFPDRKLSVMVLGNLNSLDLWDLAGKVALLYLDSNAGTKEKPHAQPVTRATTNRPLAEYTGVYMNPDQRVRRIWTTNGNLVLVAHRFARELAPSGGDRFIVTGVPGRVEVEFMRGAKGSVQMLITENGKKGLVWQRMKPKPAGVKLSEYTGTFRSRELSTDYVVNIAGEKLEVEAGGVTHPLTAEFSDGFSTPSGTTILFTRDKRSRVAGYTLSTGRANGLVFERASAVERRR